MFDGFLDALGDEDAWQDWLDAAAPLSGDGCGQAARLAGRNRSDLLSCEPVTREGDDGYSVRIETRFDTGDTLIPGTGHRTARATATAVLRPRCVPAPGDGTGDGTGDEAGDEPGEGGEGEEEDAEEIALVCDGEDLTISTQDEGDVDVRPSDLFSVVLVE
ncbi:hypothetical protein ABZ569_21730 [Streptomyces albus]|uniref:hypothetical protein n=1 Tax=Streptomyces albus TaxID=1888 RepID=UPI0033FF866F